MPVTVTVTLAKPDVRNSRKVKGKTIREVLGELNAFEEWGYYDSRQLDSNSATFDKNGKVTGVRIDMSPVIIMPEWTEYKRASKADKASWDKMYKALKKHEENHHAIQKKCLEEFKNKIEKEFKTKDLDVNTLKERVVTEQTKFQEKQDDYDKATKHGKTEGVILK
jgi:predicted secreted Zn-dependent protease